VFELSITPIVTYHFTILLVSTVGVVSSLEFLVIRQEFKPHGIFAWRIMSSRPDVLTHRWLESLLERAFNYRGTTTILIARVLGFAALPIEWHQEYAERSLLTATLVVSLLLAFRNPFGGDGSDQMTCMVLVGLMVFEFADNKIMADLGLGFIAVQSILSYSIAGVAKGLSQSWRGGFALQAILSTRTYGHSVAGELLVRAPGWLNTVTCWIVIGFECSFLSAPFLPLMYLLILLVIGCCFHVANAFAMGLNTFVWAFLATYPSVIYLNHLVTAHL
jgi:hypothetical protein